MVLERLGGGFLHGLSLGMPSSSRASALAVEVEVTLDAFSIEAAAILLSVVSCLLSHVRKDTQRSS